MLGDYNVSAVVAVKDIKKAKEFYEKTLGLENAGDDPAGIYYKSGETKMLVYESQFAGTNQATMAGWSVNDLDSVVNDLKARGVTFEHYDMPGVAREGDVHVMGDMRAVWFKDPDGNIFAIEETK